MSTFFFNDTASTEIYTLSLHDALPICYQDDDEAMHLRRLRQANLMGPGGFVSLDDSEVMKLAQRGVEAYESASALLERSEEHTSELQSRQYIVCRLLLANKKQSRLYHL